MLEGCEKRQATLYVHVCFFFSLCPAPHLSGLDCGDVNGGGDDRGQHSARSNGDINTQLSTLLFIYHVPRYGLSDRGTQFKSCDHE